MVPAVLPGMGHLQSYLVTLPKTLLDKAMQSNMKEGTQPVSGCIRHLMAKVTPVQCHGNQALRENLIAGVKSLKGFIEEVLKNEKSSGDVSIGDWILHVQRNGMACLLLRE